MRLRIFTVLIVALILLCALLFISFYREAKKTAIAKLDKEQMIHATQAAQGIEDFFSISTRNLGYLSKLEEIINVDSTGNHFLKLFYEANDDQISAITRVDKRGFIVYNSSSDSLIGKDISGQKHVLEMLHEHTNVISDVFRSVEGYYAIALHVPVFRGTEFKGSIGILIKFESLAKRYLEVIKIGETGYGWVISRDGTILYSPISGFTGKSVFEMIEKFPDLSSMVKEMLKGNQGTAEYTFDRIGERNIDSMTKYAVYMPIHIGNTFWSIAVASSEEEVLSGLNSFRNKLFFVIITIFICGVVFSFFGTKAWLIVAEEEKRKMAEEELRILNAELEQRVIERTSQLEETNKELEAFSHSVSHDLRSPLRHIKGFAELLKRDYNDRLPEEAQRYLDTISTSAKKMGILIDDLLSFSRTSRILLRKSVIQMNRLLNDSISQVKPFISDRNIDWTIPSLPEVYVDYNLLRQVWVNLLDNAIKYTRRREKALIEIGYIDEKKEIIFYVRDNGVGFDMKYSHKLFGTFQRMHSTMEFEGTGIGLANVRRIISRHGGRTWAEGEVDKGATFYFSVPRQ